jgi:predicted metal-dependent enzyme (double-stranded beta helix superfamily)
MAKIADRKERISIIHREMPALLSNRFLFRSILTDIREGKSYIDVRQATMFENEFILYINNRRLFSVRLYIYEPGRYTPVHDHNSWGVYGAVFNRIAVIRYRREDDGTKQGYARLKEFERIDLRPGNTALVMPLNEGIHRAGNPADRISVMLSVYGTPIRRLYINRYDHLQNRVEKLYPPRIRKKMLAVGALESIDDER